MKILYSIQATGNGHISRAMELLPYLKEYGEVDIFLSGDNSNLELEAPVKYRSRGLSLYYNCKGGLDYWQVIKAFQLRRLQKEVRELPVEKYDLVINDFEYITAAACAKKGIHSVNFGHQACFYSPNTPRPEKRSAIGEYVLKNYAKASNYVGLHFKRYDKFIFTPVIKKEILNAIPTNRGYIIVYLPSWCEPQLKQVFGQFKDVEFEIFSRQTTEAFTTGNISFKPVNKRSFNHSLINCAGIITGGGFETPAEALQLGKKMLCVPMKGQYEQQCNAAALQEMGVYCLPKIDHNFDKHFNDWMNNTRPIRVDYENSIPDSLNYLFGIARVDHFENESIQQLSWLPF
ncbi:MAG TPA: glycosyltransferase family protein [Chitinophagaceae bacterium]